MIARGLVGWWRLDGRLVDESGNGNDATVGAGSAAYAAGKFGQAWDANAQNIVQITDPGYNKNITISLWIYAKENQPANSTVIGYPVLLSPVRVEYRLYFFNDAFRFNFIEPLGTFDVILPIDRNKWVHVAVTFISGSEFVGYINGVEIARSSSTLEILDAGGDLYIGGENNRRFFDGQIDNAMIYNRALAAHEIRALYALGSPIGIV